LHTFATLIIMHKPTQQLTGGYMHKLSYELSQFTGTESYHKLCLFSSMRFTDGVAHMAKEGGCFWFTDKIAILGVEPKFKKHNFQVWRLTVNPTDKSAVIEVSDGNNNVIYTENITWTNFPLDFAEVWVQNNVAMLPSEY
jgi:hypothetical protein